MAEQGLGDWLAGWDDAALTGVIERRPDVVLGRAPATLGQLAERLSRPESIAAALRGLRTPAVQALEALQALGERRTREDLIALLGGAPGGDHDAAVDAVLAELTATALVWPAGGDRLAVPVGLGDVFPSPLGLGPTLREMWPAVHADALTHALRTLGSRPTGRKADLLEALLARLADPELVRRIAAQAPPEIADGLRSMVWATDDDEEDYVVLRLDPESYRRRRDAERWAADHGLMPRSAWGPVGPMPAEVALALRGPGYRAPFTPRPPELITRPVSAEVVESTTAAAVTTAAGHALALFDRVARTPIPRLAGGGIGVRELGRLTKELGIEELEVRLLLDVAGAGGLLHTTDGGVTVTDLFAVWRASEPAKQVAGLLVAWWAFPGVPSEARDESGKVLAALRRREPCGGCQAARMVMLGAAGRLPPSRGADLAGLAAIARWHRPMVHVLPQDAAEPLGTIWREAELLGVLAAGAVSPLGAALLADDVDRLQEHLRRLLPRAADSAVFGSDLTALVTGSPSARITGLLDGCADRESSGGAVTWRFSQASVRRALDQGTSAEELLEDLSEVSERPLPQPLAYLIGDVGRRHGRLRLLPAVSLIRSDDEALLAEVAADRRLAKLGLQMVAPTVLASAVPLETALDRLREAGYFPVTDRSAQRPAAPTTSPGSGSGLSPLPKPLPHPTATVDPAALARGLLADGDTHLSVPGSEIARELALSAPQLSGVEIEWLAAAVEDGGRVRIEYCAASGATTRRVIADPELDGELVCAWCELRQDERVFSAARILSVAPVG